MTDWRHDAACREATPEAAEGFFAFETQDELIAVAKRVCAACPVTEQCLTWAMASGQDFGVWGGLTADERRERRRSTNRSAATSTRKPVTTGATSSVDVNEVTHWRGLGVSDAAIAVQLGVQLETLRKAMRRADERRTS